MQLKEPGKEKTLQQADFRQKAKPVTIQILGNSAGTFQFSAGSRSGNGEGEGSGKGRSGGCLSTSATPFSYGLPQDR